MNCDEDEQLLESALIDRRALGSALAVWDPVATVQNNGNGLTSVDFGSQVETCPNVSR
jgi:hypothetical protein